MTVEGKSMTRAQCIVHRGNKLLMVKHRQDGKEWWCLPGGGVERGETPAQAALRELEEECCVKGVVVREISHVTYAPSDQARTFLVEIGAQEPRLGADPEFQSTGQILSEVKWVTLAEIPERDRAFLWAAGLLGIEEFLAEVSEWGDCISYPRQGEPCNYEQ
jgi:8-oxo-dGTP diphosphatase